MYDSSFFSSLIQTSCEAPYLVIFKEQLHDKVWLSLNFVDLFAVSYQGRAESSSYWHSHRCRRCRRAGWERLQCPVAVDPEAAEGRPSVGRGCLARDMFGWRRRMYRRGLSCYQWRLLGNKWDYLRATNQTVFFVERREESCRSMRSYIWFDLCSRTHHSGSGAVP